MSDQREDITAAIPESAPETTGAPTRPPAGLGDAGARGTGITLAVQLLRTILQFGSIVVLARLLTPEAFGLVAMVTAIIGIAEVVRDFGLSVATMRATSLSRDERTNLFWANFGLGFVCMLIAMAVTPLVVMFYDEPRLTAVVPVLATTFLINGFTTQYRAGLARDMRYKALGLTDVFSQGVSIAVAVALALAGAGMWALVAQQMTTALVGAVAFVLVARWWPGRPRRDVSIRKFVRFGGGVFGTQMIAYVTKNIDNVAIGAALGAAPLGLYSRAYQLMIMPLRQINAPMDQVALPVLSRVQSDDKLFMHYLTRAQIVGCYVTATMFAVSMGLAEPIVLVLFGEAWIDVVPIFMALAVGGMFRAVAQIAYWTYLARGQSGALLRQRLITGPVSIVLILAGLPWGPVGVAVGHSVGALFAWLFAVWHAGRATGLNTWPLVTNAMRALAQVGIPCGVAAYLGTLLPIPPIAQIVAGLAFAGIYIGLAWLLVPSVRADLNYTMSFARRAVRSGGKVSATA